MSAEASGAAWWLGGIRLEGVVFLVLTACAWGITWPVQKFLLSQLPPFSMVTGCGIGEVCLAFVVASARRERLWPPRSALNFGAFSVLTTLSPLWLRASEAVLITYPLPRQAMPGLFLWPL
jgi:hypothetical protein